MSELPGFPMVSQLDGSLNQQFDCVAASITAALRYYEPGNAFSTDATKDAAYSPSYTGPTEAWKYVDYCERNGVQLYPVYGDLVAIAHAALASGYAVLVTEQDDYAPPQYRDSWTHVCVFHKDRSGYLIAMDPYIGRDIEYSDAQWRQRMRSDCVWLMRKGEKMALHFVDGWLREAQEYNINGNSWDRGGVRATHLVVHGTAGGSNGNDTMAYMGGEGVSTHFAISTDGTIWQGVSCDRAAWGNAPLEGPRFNFDRADINPNYWTISVEFCKPDTTNGVNITDAQKASGFPLIAAICDTYSIDKRRGDGHGGIISHADINSVNRSHCPGTFPWDEMMAFLANNNQEDEVLNRSDVANYFPQGDDNRWICRNGFAIAYGHLGFFRSFGKRALSVFGLAKSNEIYLQGQYQGVVLMVYERCIAVYDPAKKLDNPPFAGDCYMLHLDQGQGQQMIAAPLVTALQQQLADAQKQVTSLTQQLQAVQNGSDIKALTAKLAQANQQAAQLAALSTQLVNLTK